MTNYLDKFKPEDIKAFEVVYMNSPGNKKESLEKCETGYKNKIVEVFLYFYTVGFQSGVDKTMFYMNINR